MAKGIYIGVDNIARKVKNMHIGKNKELEVIDYIESNGTQYIDTGIVPKSTTRVVIDYAYSSIPTDTEMMGWGSSGGAEAFAWGWRAAGGLFSTVSSNYTYNSANVSTDTDRHVFDLKSGSQKLDGVEYATDTIGNTATTGQTMYLFGLHGEWNASTAVNLCKAKIYSCQIYDGDVLVRDFIPVKDSTGTYCLYDKVGQRKFLNSGTGEFIGGEATTEKIDLGSKARKVKKGYIGIAGIARLFYNSTQEIIYYGKLEDLSTKPAEFASAKNSKYALFAGGANGDTYMNNIYAYDENLLCNTTATLSVGRAVLGGASVGDYTLFGGGATGTFSTQSNRKNTVDAYNLELVRSNPTGLSVARYYVVGGQIGSYALFAGGSNYSAYQTTVDTYNTSLVKGTATSLSSGRMMMAAANSEKYLLFAGGTSSSVSNVVDAYNVNLARSTPTALSKARSRFTGASLGNYMMFFGGDVSNSKVNTIDCYNENLVRTTPNTLSVARSYAKACSLGEFVLVAGGINTSGSSANTIDIFDSQFVRNNTLSLSSARNRGEMQSIGDYALYVGGYSAVVDAYKIS